MNKSKFLIIYCLLFCLLLLTSCSWFSNQKDKDNLSFATKTKSEKAETYILNVQYPEFKIANQTLQNKVNKEILDQVDGLIKNFQQTITESKTPSKRQFDNLLKIKFDISTLNNNLISFNYSITTNLLGAKHELISYAVFNYDLKSNKQLGLADIFDQSTDYLQKLSQAAKDVLDKNLGIDKYLATAIEPQKENFTNFNLTKDDFIFFYGTEQLQPYEFGPYALKIKTDQFNLKNIIN